MEIYLDDLKESVAEDILENMGFSKAETERLLKNGSDVCLGYLDLTAFDEMKKGKD